MSALWFSSLFEQRIGHLPSLNLPYLFASFPTILAAILSKNLLIIVLVGIASFALIQNFLTDRHYQMVVPVCFRCQLQGSNL